MQLNTRLRLTREKRVRVERVQRHSLALYTRASTEYERERERVRVVGGVLLTRSRARARARARALARARVHVKTRCQSRSVISKIFAEYQESRKRTERRRHGAFKHGDKSEGDPAEDQRRSCTADREASRVRRSQRFEC